MICPITTVPDPILTRKAPKFKDFDSAPKIIADLEDTLAKNSGLGLASPQINLGVRIALVNVTLESLKVRYGKDFPVGEQLGRLVLINPKIIKQSERKTKELEGCLSLPGIEVEIERPDEITLIYQDQSGARQKSALKGLISRVAQHEIDHLNGILITDYGPARKITHD